MNTRVLAMSVASVGILAAAWFYFAPAPAPVATLAKTAAAPAAPAPATSLSNASSPAPAPKTVPAPQVAIPKIAPVQPAHTTPTFDNQKDLSTAIPELVAYAQNGDLVTAWQTYARPDLFAEVPPERHAQVDEHLRAIMTNPDGQMRVRVMAQVLNSFSAQTPIYNEAGDTATYQVAGPAAVAGLPQVRFQKVEGRWYIANEDINRIGRLLGL